MKTWTSRPRQGLPRKVWDYAVLKSGPVEKLEYNTTYHIWDVSHVRPQRTFNRWHDLAIREPVKPRAESRTEVGW